MMNPLDKEQLIRDFLERMLGHTLKKRSLVVGTDSKKKPQIHEFDLVSDDMKIVGEVKSGSNTRNNYLSALADCVFLDKIKAKRKILVLTDGEFYKDFKAKSEGVISEEIEVMLIRTEDLTVATQKAF